jgi:hypothetical protein
MLPATANTKNGIETEIKSILISLNPIGFGQHL